VREMSVCCAGPLRAIGVARHALRPSEVARIVRFQGTEARNTSTIGCEAVDVDNTRGEIRRRDDEERHLTNERSTPMRLA